VPEKCGLRTRSCCFRRLLLYFQFSRLSSQVIDLAIKELHLRNEFGDESSVAIVDQRGLMTETRELALHNIDAATKRISFRHDALNRLCRIEEQAFDILDIIQPVDFSGLLRCFAHHIETIAMLQVMLRSLALMGLP
jgi:hypothetical protein